jgi:protein ImuA
MSLSAANTLAALRRRIASIEATSLSGAWARPADAETGPLRDCPGVTPLPGALHEVAAARESETVAASGFVLPLAAWAARQRAILWIAEEMAFAENGAFYGLALEPYGAMPERFVRVVVAHERDVLWAMEEALRCRSVGAVIGEIRGNGRGIGPIADRRLSLAAGREGAAAFLLRASPSDEPIAAATRWVVGAAPSARTAYGPGPPRLHVRLTRNRQGSLGSWMVEWNSVEQRFELTAADRQPLAETDHDRPPRAATPV